LQMPDFEQEYDESGKMPKGFLAKGLEEKDSYCGILNKPTLILR
jgi:hypothetical protein